MRTIKQSVDIIDTLDGEAILRKLELCGRVCYKSEDRSTDTSAAAFVKRLIDSKHESVLEHVNVSVRFITDRGVSHEIVRHRIASYSQESTRYCRYDKDLVVIHPVHLEHGSREYELWHHACATAETLYRLMLDEGHTPQEARTALPHSTKTDLIMTANLREWRHFLKLRTSPAAHPQIRSLARELKDKLTAQIPVIFDDL